MGIKERKHFMDYSPRELMVVCASRQIRDDEHVFVGMRLPLIAFALAKQTHAPNCIGLFEGGIVRDVPATEVLYTMGDAPNIAGSLWTTSTLSVMGLLAVGEAHLGFIGGAEVDRYGNLNTSIIGDWKHPSVRLPGSGGAADIASFSRRLAIIMQHDRHRLRERVNFVTSPGYGYPSEEGPAGVVWRERVGLPRGGPSALITTLGLFTFDPENGEAMLQSYHPGTTIEEIQEQTGWKLRLAEDCQETIPPSEKELKVSRKYDPRGVWTS
jgi:glutaconate CoA-transferase subunit B